MEETYIENMSAYIVEKNHVLFLLAAAESRAIRQCGPLTWYHNEEHHRLPVGDYEALADLGNMLWRENMQSVGYRYQHESSATLPGPNDPCSVITAQDVRRVLWNHVDPVQVIKSCDCYGYQTCEHKEWDLSEAKAFVDNLRSSAWHALKGYDAAKWGAPEPMSGNVISLMSLCRK